MRDPLAWVKVCGAERVSSAGAPFADAVPFAAALVEAAPDRVLWGTDWPHPNIAGDMPNDGDLVDLFAQVTADERRAAPGAGGQPDAALLGLSPVPGCGRWLRRGCGMAESKLFARWTHASRPASVSALRPRPGRVAGLERNAARPG